MKKILCAVLAVVMLLCLTACGGTKLNGTYSADMFIGETTYEFSKNGSVSVSVSAFGAELFSGEGKYSIEDDKITITFTSGEDSDEKDELEGTFDFELKEDSIKIGIVEYEKEDK